MHTACTMWHARRAVGRRRLLGTNGDELLLVGHKGSQPAESGATNAEVMMESVEYPVWLILSKEAEMSRDMDMGALKMQDMKSQDMQRQSRKLAQTSESE